jgi:tetratricopeptide (TPR) repeat protein
MQRSSIRAAALLLCPVSHAAIAADYWSYAYKDFDVTAVGSSGYTVSLAHDVARFDKALNHILQLSERHPPTHIYELEPKQEKDLLGEVGVVSYKFSGYEVSVITDTRADRNSPRWGALFGYTGSLLVSGRAVRAPYWFQVGVPQLFANTEFESGRIKTGGVSVGFARVLRGGKLIPTRIFLRMQGSDPQLRAPSAFKSLFEAQSWYLAREVYVEGKLRTEFWRYLALMREGKSEADAFATSFKLSYEDLDKLLVDAMSEPTHVFVVDVPREPPDNQQPRKLSEAETKAMLADLNLQWQHRANALRLASEALQGDPHSELSLRVLARANLQEGNFDASLAAVDKLVALTAPSAAALTDGGEVLSRLAREVSAKQAAIGVDSDTLSRRARDAYEHAIGLDPDYLRSWSGLANLYSSPHDSAAAQAFVARAQPMMEKHLESAALARALATMCSRTGQTAAAFLFGEYWRADAITPRDLDEALAFMARMHSQ